MCDDKQGSCGGHEGGCGSHRGCGHKSLLWWLIALVVGIIIFCTGVKVGVLKSYYGGWGYNQGYPAMMGGWGYGMMRGYNNLVVPAQTATTSQK